MTIDTPSHPIPTAPAPAIASDSADGGQLASLQWLRGCAALLVVFHHYAGTAVERGFAIPGLEHVQLGNAGTDLFFLISGFIIEFRYGSSPCLPGDRLRFLQRRAARVLPLYWVLTLAAFAITMLLPAVVTSTTTVQQLGMSMLLLPNGSVGAYVIPLAWTLSFSVLFYLVFALLMPLAPFARIGAFALACAAALLVPESAVEGRPLLGMLLHPLLWEFIAGMVLARMVMRGWRAAPFLRAALLAAGLVMLVGEAETNVTASLPRLFYWGLPALLLVAAAVLGETPRVPAAQPLWMRPLTWLGDISYALAATHFFSLALFAKVYFQFLFNLRLSPWLSALALLALSLVVAQLAHLLVEKPGRRWLTRRPDAQGQLATA